MEYDIQVYKQTKNISEKEGGTMFSKVLFVLK